MATHLTSYVNQLKRVLFFILLVFITCKPAFSQINKPAPPVSVQGGKIQAPVFLLADSLPVRLKNTGASFKQAFLSSFKNSNSAIVPDLVRNSMKNITGATSNLFKNPVAFLTADIDAGGQMDSSYLRTGKQQYRSHFDFSSDWTVAGMPLGVSFQQQSWSDFKGDDLFLFSFQFDRAKYLEQLKKNLSGKINPSHLLNNLKNPLDDIVTKARQSLMTELESISNSYKGLLDDNVQQIKSLQNVFALDIKSIKNKFLSPSFIESISENRNRLAILQQQLSNGEKVDARELSDLQDEVRKMAGLQDLVSKMEQHKARWEQSGLLKKIKEFDVFKQLSISRLMNDPSVITRLARQKLSLSGLQRFFLNVNRLDLGQNALSTTPLSFRHFLSKGISTELLSNKRSLSLVAGKQTDFNSIMDFPFSETLFSNSGTVKSFGIGAGNGTRSTTNFSLSSFSQSMAGLNDRLNPAMLRQVLVTTVSNQLSLGGNGMIDVELSRSATTYNMQRNSGDSGLPGKNNLSSILSTEDFMANTAISLRYADELTDHGLSYHVQFNKTANGYTNPGNSYLSTGTTELGTGLRKSLFKSKLQVSFRGNVRIYKYNDRGNTSLANTNMLLDAKWKLRKGQYIAIRYQPVKMARKEQGAKTPLSSVERVAVDASVYRKFGKIAYRNVISLSGQKNLYSLGPTTIVKNSSLMINSFQHLLIGKRMIYINVNYNHAANAAQYAWLNSSLYAETGYSYRIGKNISASSGIIYNGMKGWYNQAGVRQTISGELGDKFSVNIYVDVKKNLRVITPLADDPVRADIALRYILKNNKN